MTGSLVFLFFAFISLLLIPSHGRNLQKINYTDETIIASSKRFLSSNIKVNAVSHATYTGKTNYNDVLGLVAWVTAYPLLEEANDDPCLAPQWTWIECNSDPSPRVIALDLSNKLLIGDLPDFSSMDALQRIDVSQNSLIGTIPAFLGTFTHLQELNLAFNLFYGLVPDSLACNKNLKLTLTGNSGLYTSNSCLKSNGRSSPSTPAISNDNSGFSDTPETYSSNKKKSNVRLIVGITVPLLAVFWIAVGVFAIFRHKAKTAAAVAAASAQPAGPNDSPGNPKPNTPSATEEVPINPRQ